MTTRERSAMAVITISKEFASGGVTLAHDLAKELNYKLVGRSVLAELARRLGMSEAEVELLKRGKDTRWIRLVDNYLLHTVRRMSQQPDAALDDKQYFQAVQKLIRDVASEGDVVTIGWGAQFILMGMPDVVNIRVVAPLEDRGLRLHKDRGIPVEQAVQECERQDGYSQSYIKTYLGGDWAAPHNYHMVVNMGALGFDFAKAIGAVKSVL